MTQEHFKIDLVRLVANPNNPRGIKKDKLEKLKKSLQEFPEMMDVRPIVIDEHNVILGGNMRFKAMLELGIQKTSAIRLGGLTQEQKNEFIIKDNVGFGEWDWDLLVESWDVEQLSEWGMDVPSFGEVSSDDQPEMSNGWFLNIEFENEQHCQEWFDKLKKEGLVCKIVQ